MARIIYLHIGHFKTGTTALQVAMKKNASLLRRAGLEYSNANLENAKHSALGFSVLKDLGVTELMHGYNCAGPAAQHWNTLFDAARNSAVEEVIVSSEEMIRFGAYDGATQILRDIIDPVRDEFEFRIIVYLRAPQSHLRSWYNQLIKMNVRPVPAFDAAVCDVMEPIHYDYALALKPWIDVFGEHALTIRPYTDDLRKGDALFHDFFSIFDIPFTSKFSVLLEDANLRLSDDVLEVTRMMQTAQASAVDIERAQRRVRKLREDVRAQCGVSFEDVVARAKDGLAQVQTLIPNAGSLDVFSEQLPGSSSEDHTRDLENLADVLVFVLRDIKTLRDNFHQRQAEMLQRIQALEAKEGAAKQ